MKSSIALATLFLSMGGCAHWRALQPLGAPNAQVGELSLTVNKVEYAGAGDRLKLEVMVENPSAQPQMFDPQWVSVRGASGRGYGAQVARPIGLHWVAPGSRTQVSYMFRGISERETEQLTLLIGGTATVQFSLGSPRARGAASRSASPAGNG